MPTDNAAILATLTPGRLLEIAEECRWREHLRRETVETTDEISEVTRGIMAHERLMFSRLAALCEAVADAERAMAARPNLSAQCVKYSETDYSFTAEDDYDAVWVGWPLLHPPLATLAAALGAVGETK